MLKFSVDDELNRNEVDIFRKMWSSGKWQGSEYFSSTLSNNKKKTKNNGRNQETPKEAFYDFIAVSSMQGVGCYFKAFKLDRQAHTV